MKKILIAFLALVTALSCLAFIGCENKVEGAQKNEDKQATLDMYIFDKDGQTISEDFVLPGKIGKYDATWTSNNAIIALEELAGDEENGIERQYVAKVGLPEERTEINLTVALSEEVTKSFTVYVNSLSVYDFSGSYNFIQNNGTVFTSFALDTTCEYKGYTATITWSVDEEYADYLEISEDGKECIVYPSSLNPKVRINATFTYNGESTTKGYRMTVSEQKEPLQEVDYWYTNEGVGIVMSGYVVSIATVYSESYANVSLYMVNDEFTAGYYLYRVKADSQSAALLAPGVHVTVTGTTNTNYNGLFETNANGTLVVDADVPSININEAVYAVDNDVIGNLQSAHYNQSRLVSLTNWKVKEIKSTPDLSSGTQTLFVLTKAGVDVPVVISKYQEGAYAYSTDDATCAALIALQGTVKVGDILSVTGILGNYKGHQIAPLSAEAVVVGGTADAEGTVYAGQKAAKAVVAIDKLIADNGLASIVAVAKNVQLPATVEGCEVAFRVIGEPRSISIVDGALVINPGKMERACLTAAITVDGFTTNIFRYIDAADLDDAGKVELEEKELTFVTDEAINADTVLTVPVVGNLFNNVTISWASNNECAVVDGSTITVTVPEEIVEVIFTATITLNNAVLTKEFVVEVGKPANISLVDFVALASALENKAATTKKYIVSGIVTEVANTTYGNLYITDAAGNTLYVYGCYDADGANRYDAMATAPQVGDYVTLFGVASNYNGPQMKNAWVQTCVNPTTVVEAIAIADKLEHNTTTTEKYLVTGTITEVYNTTYGNMYITDAEGNVLTIYGTYSEDGSLRYDAIGEAAPKAGDVVTVYGVASKYNTTCQLKNAWIVLVTAGNHEHDFTGEWKSNASKHWHECVCGEIMDEADHVYVSGVCECGAKEPVAGSVVLTVDSLSIPSQTYATGTATVNGVSFEFVQLGNYGNGLQMRDNPEKGTTLLWNTSALGTGISKIELVYHSSKTTYNNDDAIIFSFGNAVDSLTSITNFSTVAGTYNYTVTPDAGTYTFFKLEYDYDKSAYWASITIYFEGDSGEVTPPVECEHVWTDATCTAPKTCSKCGETEGEALGHTFVDGACSVCGAKDPNYVAPGEKVFGIINAPVAGTAYKFGMVQEKKNDGKVYYLTGAMSGYYMATTTDETAALDVYLEETTGGYYLYAMINGAKTYINMVVSGTHVNGAYQAAASTVYRYDAESKTVIAVVNDTDYWFGTRNDNTYTTVGPCAVSYKGFYCKFYGWIEGETPVECEHSWVDATCTAPKTCSKCGATEGEKAAHTWVDATCTAPKTCSVCKATEGEALAHTFVDGACSVCGAADPDYVAPEVPVVSGGKADFNTIATTNASGDSSYTKTFTTADGWEIKYAAIQTGGSTVMNPQFPVIGPDNTHKAVCLNGKTSAPGSITSPTLTGGIDKLTVAWTKMFSDANIKVTVTVTDLATGAVQTFVLENTGAGSNEEKYVVHTVEWTLDTAISGDFTISFVNSCPSNLNSNKDRCTILSVEWTAPEAACAHIGGTATCKELAVCELCGEAYGELAAHDWAEKKGDKEDPEAGTHNGHWSVCTLCGAETEVIAHVDANLDITCDYEGCTKRILPAADTKVSLFTANHMRIVSLTSNYYVEGVVTLVDDAKNGIFVITDEAGDSLTIKLPKNAEGTAYSSWTSGKVVLGDTIQVYGQPKTTTSSTLAPKAMIQGGVLTVLKHEHVFSEPTCTEDGVCGCLAVGTPALGHADEDKDGYCDRCQWNMKLVLTTLNTHNDPATGTNPVLDEAKTFWTWSNDEFDITLSKGTSTYTLYTSVKAYMQIKTNNVTTITNKTGALISTITMKATNTSYLGYLKSNFAESDIIVDETALTLTINWNSSENFSFVNTNSQSIRIESVTIAYEPKEEAPVECAHEWTGMDSNEKGHWLVCVLCKATGEVSEHTERVTNNGETHARECGHCGYVIAAEEAHVYTDGTCACGAQEPAEVVVLTVAEFIEICNTYAHNTYSNDKYYVAGVITSVTNTQYGNMTIKDATGEVLIYGTYNADGSEGYSAMADKPVVGHTITVYTIAGTYSNAPQGKNGWIVEHTPSHTCVYSTEWNSDANNHWNSCVYCAVANEESRVAHTFADGKCNVCGMVDPSTSAFSLTKVTSMDQLVEGAVIVLTYNDKFTMGAISGKYFSSVAFSKTATEVASNWVTLTLEKSASGNWVLKTKDGKYVASNGNGNYAQAAASVTNIAEWTITLSNGKLKIQNVALTDRYLQYNASSPRFACYKTTSNQADPEAYIVSGI